MFKLSHMSAVTFDLRKSAISSDLLARGFTFTAALWNCGPPGPLAPFLATALGPLAHQPHSPEIVITLSNPQIIKKINSSVVGRMCSIIIAAGQ